MSVSSDIIPTYFFNKPNPIVLTQDGRINFLPFDMVPDTIVVNGFRGLVGSDGLSVIPIKELVNLGYFQPNAGTPLDPLRVEGKLLTEDVHDKDIWAPLVMTVQNFFGLHSQPAYKSATSGRFQALVGKRDRTV